MSFFCISITFLDPYFHGRCDGGAQEWPPSPLRLLQAIVAASANGCRLDEVRPALQWLERQPAPMIIAPPARATQEYRLYVPNNAMDLVAAAWARGTSASIADYRTKKDVRATQLVGGDAVHYVWSLPDPLPDGARTHVETLANTARSIVALGWGIDLVAGRASILDSEGAGALAGERWLPVTGQATNRLRVPMPGTLASLESRHRAFLNRMSDNSFTPPPPLSAFSMVGYRRSMDPPPRPFAAFSLLKPDGTGFRPFDTARRACTVAGMMRHVAEAAARDAGWAEDRVNAFVLGHSAGASSMRHLAVGPRRFAYLPLPSLEARGEGHRCVAGSVRRMLVTAFTPDCAPEIDWARQSLAGRDLIDEHDSSPKAMLKPIPASETMVRRYTQPSASWATVTPVILPGHDDYHGPKIEALLRKAIGQAGFPQELARHAQIEWRGSGFLPGVDLASRYRVPNHLQRYPRLHVRITWRDANGQPVRVPGPVCLGGGRFYGLGLFAAEPWQALSDTR